MVGCACAQQAAKFLVFRRVTDSLGQMAQYTLLVKKAGTTRPAVAMIFSTLSLLPLYRVARQTALGKFMLLMPRIRFGTSQRAVRGSMPIRP